MRLIWNAAGVGVVPESDSPRRERGILVNSTVKTIMFWLFILVCLVMLWAVVSKSANLGGKDTEISYSDLYAKVNAQQVESAELQGPDLRGHLKGSKDQFHTTVGSNYEDLKRAMLANGVAFKIKPESSNLPLQLLLNIGPFVLFGAVWFFGIRQMQSGGNKALSFGKSRARLLSMQQKKVTFKDVAGVDEAKEKLK